MGQRNVADNGFAAGEIPDDEILMGRADFPRMIVENKEVDLVIAWRPGYRRLDPTELTLQPARFLHGIFQPNVLAFLKKALAHWIAEADHQRQRIQELALRLPPLELRVGNLQEQGDIGGSFRSLEIEGFVAERDVVVGDLGGDQLPEPSLFLERILHGLGQDLHAVEVIGQRGGIERNTAVPPGTQAHFQDIIPVAVLVEKGEFEVVGEPRISQVPIIPGLSGRIHGRRVRRVQVEVPLDLLRRAQ